MFFKKKIVNKTFGKLVCGYSWYRDVTYELWGKTHIVKLSVEKPKEKEEILPIQEQAYLKFLNSINQVGDKIKEYLLNHYDEILDDYYICCGTSWGSTPAKKQQLQRIIDSYESEGKTAIDDMLDNISLSNITVEETGRIVLCFYVNIPDGHGLILVFDSDIKIMIPEEYDDWVNQ